MTRITVLSTAFVAMVAAACSGATATSAPTAVKPPTAAPQPRETTGAATEAPVRSPASPPPLTQTYTSAVHGLSIAYPTGWIVRKPATEPWNGEPLLQESTFADVIEDGSAGDTAFLAMASDELAGKVGADWSAAYLAAKPEDDCGPRTVERITVDGAQGILAAHCPDGYFVFAPGP